MRRLKTPTLRVEQNELNPVAPKVLAESIVAISKAMEAFDRSGLNRRAIYVLVKAHCNVPHADTEAVLNALKDLRRLYTVLPEKKA